MRLRFATLLLGAALPLASHAADDPLLTAGQLRTAAQRIAKLILQAPLDGEPGRVDNKLKQQMESVRQALEQFATPAFARARPATLERTRRHWENLLALGSSGSPGNVDAPGLLAEQASLASGKLAMEMTQQRGLDPRTQLADLALRQGMLAQRMARLYLLGRSGGAAGGVGVDWEQTRREYLAASQSLREAAPGVAGLKARLDLADTQWIFFEQAMARATQGGRPLPQDSAHVASTSDRIVEAMGEAAQLLLAVRSPGP